MALMLVSGALANKPHNGGEAWVRLSWIQGLKKLGFDVLFIEQIQRTAAADMVHRRYFDEIIERAGLSGSAALIDQRGHSISGPAWPQILDAVGSAEALINISGHLTVPWLLSRIRRKVYVDIDPGFTQIWHEQGLGPLGLADHDFHFTIGQNIGRPECTIPTCGIRWRTTCQPVVLGDWPVCSSPRLTRFTTIANWRGPYGRLQYDGKTLGLKVHEFRKVITLPQLVEGLTFEIALDIHPADEADRQLLGEHGWKLRDPKQVASSPDRFRQYVQQSSAEFSVAQGVYVETQSGWFSDRSVRYLASGKPVLVQDTGLGDLLPVGQGLVVFRDLEQAVAGARCIQGDYRCHCDAARHLAETHFDSDRVLGRLLDQIGVAA